jgi:hypothetical protein
VIDERFWEPPSEPRLDRGVRIGRGSPNHRIRLAVVGLARGGALVSSLHRLGDKNVEVAALCNVDFTVLERRAAKQGVLETTKRVLLFRTRRHPPLQPVQNHRHRMLGWFGVEACAVEDPHHFTDDRGVSYFDQPLAFVGSVIYKLPVGANKRFRTGQRAVHYLTGNSA